MAAVFHRVFLLYNLVNSLIQYFIPKKLASFLYKTHQSILVVKESKPDPPPSSIERHHRRMDQTELCRVFQMFDRNGDGHITQKELSDSLENLGIFISEKDLIAMIEKIDVNGDGCVDETEFGELYETIMDEKDEDVDLREAFNVFDQNGDGYITVDELRSILVSLGVKQGRTMEDCKIMIRKVDVDGDGRVNYKEFKEMMRGGGCFLH